MDDYSSSTLVLVAIGIAMTTLGALVICIVCTVWSICFSMILHEHRKENHHDVTESGTQTIDETSPTIMLSNREVAVQMLSNTRTIKDYKLIRIIENRLSHAD